jgi:tetratricopeptide (TPR) repeat protein
VLGHVVAVYSLNVRLRFDEARHHAEQAALLSRKYQLRQGVFIANVLLAMIEHATGDPEAAARRYQEEFEQQRGVGSVDADAALLLALTTVRYTQGRLAELIDDLRITYREVVPAVGHLLALALAESGALEEARAVLAEAPALEEDYVWPVLASMRGLTAAAVGDVAVSAELYDQLLPFADQVAGGGTNGFFLTPIASVLGRLATTLGRPEAARRHFEQALAVAGTCGSPAWIARAQADLVAAAV